ncbi:MAG: hypothetical protein JW945_08195, partial [Methanomicrobia archaeon]|nr:hypothetical protein [Methanomicrobia archaeon]
TDDVIASIELVEDLNYSSSLIVPMNFVSMRGVGLNDEETFTLAKMTQEHWQLMGLCVEHNLRVIPKLMRVYQTGRDLIRNWLLCFAARWMTQSVQQYVATMKRGEPPIARREASRWLYPDIPVF